MSVPRGASPAARLADDPVEDPRRRRADGTRRSSGRRRWVPDLAGQRLRGGGSAVSGVGGRPSRAASGRARADRRGRPRSRAPPGRRATSRRPATRHGHHDLADRLGAARADLAEAHLAVGDERDPDPEDQLVVGERGLAIAGPEVGGRIVRSPRSEPTTMTASAASSTGSVSPAGDALAMLPPSVPRFWIWAGADRGGGLDQRRDVLAARGRSGGSPCTSSGRRARARRRRWRCRAGVDRPQVDDARRGSPPARRSADHQVRAAGDRPDRRLGGSGRQHRVRRSRSRGLVTGGSIGIGGSVGARPRRRAMSGEAIAPRREPADRELAADRRSDDAARAVGSSAGGRCR